MSANIWTPGLPEELVDAETSNRTQEFTATAGQSVFNLTSFTYAINTESIAVYKNGARVRKARIIETASNQVTLLDACALNDVVEIVAVIGSTSANAIAAAASAATASAAAANLPNAVTAGHDKVLVSDPAGTSWLYKTVAQLKTFLGYGTAANFNVGTAANNVVQLNAGAQLPAVGAGSLTNLNPLGIQGAEAGARKFLSDEGWTNVPIAHLIKYVTGRYYGAPCYTRAAAGFTSTQYNGKLYFVPFYCAQGQLFSSICCNVSTLIAAKVIRLGIYVDNGAGAPGSLAMDAGTVSFASTGVKEAAASAQLKQGWYWLALATDSTATGILDSYTLATDQGIIPMGHSTFGSPVVGYSANFVYTTLPVDTSALTLTALTGATTVLPALYLKV